MAKKAAADVVYARSDRQFVNEIILSEGMTYAEAAEKSGVFRLFPELLEAPRLSYSSYGVSKKSSDIVNPGDRVELSVPAVGGKRR